MIHEFADIPLLPVVEKPKIRFKKLAKDSGKGAGIQFEKSAGKTQTFRTNGVNISKNGAG